jgi:hypothetical protein
LADILPAIYSRRNTGAIAGGVSGTVVFLLIIISILYARYKVRRQGVKPGAKPDAKGKVQLVEAGLNIQLQPTGTYLPLFMPSVLLLTRRM